MTKIEKLERIKNYATRYEVALTLADGRKMLVCYTPRKNKTGLLSAIQQRGKGMQRLGLHHRPQAVIRGKPAEFAKPGLAGGDRRAAPILIAHRPSPRLERRLPAR